MALLLLQPMLLLLHPVLLCYWLSSSCGAACQLLLPLLHQQSLLLLPRLLQQPWVRLLWCRLSPHSLLL
jgi:hypothetical protein